MAKNMIIPGSGLAWVETASENECCSDYCGIKQAWCLLKAMSSVVPPFLHHAADLALQICWHALQLMLTECMPEPHGPTTGRNHNFAIVATDRNPEPHGPTMGTKHDFEIVATDRNRNRSSQRDGDRDVSQRLAVRVSPIADICS